MNLLDEKWIPVRRANGQQDWIAPFQVSEPDIIALDARRPDFNGALIQFLIGLVQTTTPMDSEAEWEEWDKSPPSMEVLQRWFAPVRDAFVFDGDGARFMQDFELRTEMVKENDLNSISALLIEAPGDNALKENRDHFIKRDSIEALCMHCAAAALFTLQTNAPAGGAGILTSIRGGGPLTTLIKAGGNSLWHLVWLNMKPRTQFLAATGDHCKGKLQYIFPWAGAMPVIQPDGGQLTPIQVHPAHAFWGMPRRIRLDLNRVSQGMCSCCEGMSSSLVIRYATKPRGLDYKRGWLHPLSPYYENKPGEMLPLHPQPGGIGYKHWSAWLLGMEGVRKRVQPASTISYVLESGRLRGKQYRLWAFGYDMDKMKARCWYESSLPLYGLAEKNIDGRNLLQREVARWVDAADHAAFLCRTAVKSAWFGDSAEARGDFSFIDSHFWAASEKQFYPLLRNLIEQARDEDDDPALLPLRENWRSVLVAVAEKLFDSDFIGVAPIEHQNPRRTAEAFNRLRMSLHSDKLKAVLSLPVEKPEKSRKKTAKSAA
ncbi:MAG: type I-E CRISPR-associated protein Cse1/CasA [Moraxellaceae bacterium]|nr:type I-E CRISPR-associated protein Cse1/CasA [Moraxellaceae bacterium]